jgi:PAS domain S-box-containing protein
VEGHLLPDTLNAENARNPLTPEELAQSVWGVRDKSGPMILPPRPGGIERSEVTMDIDVSPWPLNWQLIFRPREAWYAGEGGITRRVWLIGGIAMILSLGLLIQIEIKNKTLVHFANRTIETAALLETVLDGTEDYGIIATDLAGRMVRANRGCERLFGHPPSDLIGQSINLLSHPRAATHDKLEHILRSTLESGRYDDVVAVRGPDAEMRQVQLSCAARTDADGNPIGFVLIMHDVTSLLDRTMRLEQLNAQLAEQTQVAQRAHRLVNEFLATMSHELRTPLNAILGYTRLVHRKAGPQLEPRQSENLTKILRAGEGLLGLINDLLDLSKIQAGRMPIQCEEFKVGKVIDEVVDTIGPLAEAQRDQIVVNIDRTMLPMVTDRTHMRQILVNLMANAIKFTNKGTIEIRVRPERPTDAVRIEVIDSGVGIPEEQLNRIFEPFYQVETEGKRPDSGTGLGLSIVQRLVRHLGGEIRVDSRVGQGSVFCVTLPRDITTTQGHAAAAVHPTPQQVMPPEMGA